MKEFFDFDPAKAEQMKEAIKESDPEVLSEVLKITNFARDILEKVASGKKIDMEEFLLKKQEIKNKWGKNGM